MSTKASNANYIGQFPVELGMCLLFTDFQQSSESSLGIMEKFQRHSALPNIKYTYSVLFLCFDYLCVVQNIFSHRLPL